MKNKSDLKRKVLCSLLAASTMGIFLSSDALAAQVNGVEVPENGVITNEWLNTPVNQGGPGSQKFIIAQGDKVVIATHSDVKNLITGIQNALKDTSIVGTMDKVNAIRQVLAENNIVIGVVGGEGQLDTSLNGVLILAGTAGQFAGEQEISDLVGKIVNINTIGTQGDNVTLEGDTNLTIGQGNGNSPVVIGYIGGDMSVNTGMTGSLGINYNGLQLVDPDDNQFKKHETSITRNGNINNFIKSGNVIGGLGGSAAVTIGNITLNAGITANVGEDDTVTVDLNNIKFDGKTTTTINGDINTVVAGNIDTTGNITEGSTANIGAFANGGAAVAIGGTSDSIVNGNSTLIIDSNVNTKGGLDGITAGVAGGGVALTTIGGTANSEVNGNVNIGINNGLAIGVVGGGVAGAADATGAVEAIKGGQVGNDDGTSGLTLEELKTLLGEDAPGFINDNITSLDVKVDNAIQGGEATATVKGDTRIELTGNTTAIGVIGGGVAAASHTYTWKNDGTNSEAGLGKDDVNKAYGSSNATANTTGKATIVVDLESPNKDAVAANIGGALSSVISAVKDGDLSKINAEGVVGQGAAVGVFGGGVAFGHGSLRGTIDGEGEEAYGAYAVANNEGGADIYLLNGYAAGVFGGGAAGTLNNAKAETNTGAVNTYIGEGMKAVGVFGGGFAVSMEGELSPTDPRKGTTNGTLAYSNVDSNNIEVYGNVEGIYGGGMAIGNSVLSADNYGKDAVTKVGTTNITVNNGTIDRLQLISIMNASKNDNNTNTDKGYQTSPWWNSLGMNASMAMVDLKGITDETSIAAGGMGMGMTGYSEVETANITINGGNVTKDILGGGIAVDNITGDNENTADVREGAGAHVGESTITLNGGTVGGSVYAGGAVNGTTPEIVLDKVPSGVEGHEGYNTDKNSSTVGTAKVVLNGTEVTGEISGQGYELTTKYEDNNDFNPYDADNNYVGYEYEKNAYDSVGESTLEITGNNTLSALDTTKGNYVGTSKIHSFDNINVAAGSVTTLDGSLEAGNTVALIDAKLSDTEKGVITVADGAKLNINELTANEGNTYLVASNYAENSKLWENNALAYDRTENYAAISEDENGYKITYEGISDKNVDKATDSFVDAIGGDGEEIRNNIEGLLKDKVNTFSGFDKFMKDASTSSNYTDVGKMAMIGEAAGVTSNTIDVAGDMADNSVLRLSFTQDDITGEPKVNEDGAIWAKYIHNKHDLDGMASSFGSVDSSSDFDGATIGVDFAKKGKVQSGIAFSYGSGDSHGMGINNDFDMWGLTLYGNVKNDDTNVIADIGFSESDNELTGKAMGKDIKADRDVSVFTVGVRAEKLYTNGSTQIVPYTGLRYYNVDPDSYTAYYDGQKFGEYDADRQNIWTLPVGVSLRNETVTESGWRLTPKVDVAYIWAFGDTDNSFDLNTGSGVDTLDYTVMDSGSWLGSVGFEAGKDDWAFGVGYSYQKGSHEEANKWFVNVEYSF